MNSFGRLFRIQIFGESHGPGIFMGLDGVPAGLPLAPEDFGPDLDRRKPGQAGTTPRQEADVPELRSGVYRGFTTGAPLLIAFANANVRSADYEALAQVPRPGHADFVLHEKWGGFSDPRGGGHSSGRLTVALVAAGVVAKKMLPGMAIQARVIQAGGEADVAQAVQKAVAAQDSIGGLVECRATGLPVGLGEPFFDSLESVLAHLAFAIPAIKGIEFGAGFAAAAMTGSVHNDALEDASGRTATNHAGGINGGISNGNELVFRVAVKPTSSTPRVQKTWSRASNRQEALRVAGRHDLCIALRVPVVLEAITAIAVADLLCIRHP